LKNLLIRSLSGLVYLAALLGGMLYNQYSFMFVFTLIAAICAMEFTTMLKKLYPDFNIYFVNFSIPALSVFSFFCFSGFIPMYFISAILFMVPLVFLRQLYNPSPNPFIQIGLQLMGWLYLAIPFTFVYFMVFNPFTGYRYDATLIIGFFIMLWTNDTFAYLFGRFFGRNKLFKSVSPKKTWEGYIGGTLATFTSAFFIANHSNMMHMVHWLVIAGIVSTFGAWGDLVESLFKRAAGVKDSGSIMPGHGGLLDRFDSVIFSVPIVVLYLYLIAYL